MMDWLVCGNITDVSVSMNLQRPMSPWFRCTSAISWESCDHNDAMMWKRFPRFFVLYEGAFDVSLMIARINCWTNRKWPVTWDVMRPHDKMITAHSIATKLDRYISLVMFATWLNFGEIMLETFFNNFFLKFMVRFGNGTSRSDLNFLYLSPKCFDCHETKNKHIDWTLGLK